MRRIWLILMIIFTNAEALSQGQRGTSILTSADLLNMSQSDLEKVGSDQLRQNVNRLRLLDQQEREQELVLQETNQSLCETLKGMEDSCVGLQYIMPTKVFGGVNCGGLEEQLKKQNEAKVSDKIIKGDFVHASGWPSDVCYRFRVNDNYISDKICSDKNRSYVRFNRSTSESQKLPIRMKEIGSFHIVAVKKDSELTGQGLVITKKTRFPEGVKLTVSIKKANGKKSILFPAETTGSYQGYFELKDLSDKTNVSTKQLDPLKLATIRSGDKNCFKDEDEINSIKMSSVQKARAKFQDERKNQPEK